MRGRGRVRPGAWRSQGPWPGTPSRQGAPPRGRPRRPLNPPHCDWRLPAASSRAPDHRPPQTCQTKSSPDRARQSLCDRAWRSWSADGLQSKQESAAAARLLQPAYMAAPVDAPTCALHAVRARGDIALAVVCAVACRASERAAGVMTQASTAAARCSGATAGGGAAAAGGARAAPVSMKRSPCLPPAAARWRRVVCVPEDCRGPGFARPSAAPSTHRSLPRPACCSGSTLSMRAL